MICILKSYQVLPRKHVLRDEYIWNVHGIMNTSDLLQRASGFMLNLQETRSIHDSMNIPKIEFITYTYILLSTSNL